MVERARRADGVADRQQPAIGKAAQRQRPRQLAAAENAGLDPGLPDAGAVKRRIVELERPFEVPVRFFDLAEVEEGGAERPLADHLQVLIADALEERHHLDRQPVGGADLAGDDVMRRHPDQDGDDARRIVDLARQLAGPLVGAADLGDGVALAGLDRESVRHLQRRARPRRGPGPPARSSAARGRAAPAAPTRRARRAGRPPAPPGSRTRRRARDRARPRTAPRCPTGNRMAGRRSARTSRSAIARLNAALRVARSESKQTFWYMWCAKRYCSVSCRFGRLDFADEPDHGLLAFEPLEPRLDLLVFQLQRAGDEGGVEVHSLYARGAEQPAVGLVEPVELALDQAAHRLRAARRPRSGAARS